MADVSGVKIIDLTAAGSSDDGEHVWITHRLGDGSEYPLILSLRSCGISDHRVDRRGSLGVPAAHRAKPRGGRRGAQHKRRAGRGGQGRHLAREIRGNSASDDCRQCSTRGRAAGPDPGGSRRAAPTGARASTRRIDRWEASPLGRPRAEVDGGQGELRPKASGSGYRRSRNHVRREVP